MYLAGHGNFGGSTRCVAQVSRTGRNAGKHPVGGRPSSGQSSRVSLNIPHPGTRRPKSAAASFSNVRAKQTTVDCVTCLEASANFVIKKCSLSPRLQTDTKTGIGFRPASAPPKVFTRNKSPLPKYITLENEPNRPMSATSASSFMNKFVPSMPKRVKNAGPASLRAKKRMFKTRLGIEYEQSDYTSICSFPESATYYNDDGRISTAYGFIKIHEPLARPNTPVHVWDADYMEEELAETEKDRKEERMVVNPTHSRFDRYVGSHRPKFMKSTKAYLEDIQKRLKTPTARPFVLKTKANRLIIRKDHDKEGHVYAWLEENGLHNHYGDMSTACPSIASTEEQFDKIRDAGRMDKDPRCTCDAVSVISEFSDGGTRYETITGHKRCIVHLPSADVDWESDAGQETAGRTGQDNGGKDNRQSDTLEVPDYEPPKDQTLNKVTNNTTDCTTKSIVYINEADSGLRTANARLDNADTKKNPKVKNAQTDLKARPQSSSLRDRLRSKRRRRGIDTYQGTKEEDNNSNKEVTTEEQPFMYSVSWNEILTNLGDEKLNSDMKSKSSESIQDYRFELPMDMKVLEDASAKDYLSQYCILSPQRAGLYNKIFGKYKKRYHIETKDLHRALKEILVNTITKEDMTEVCQLAQLEEHSKIDLKLFSGLAAMFERILNKKKLYVANDSKGRKEIIESADFSALKWKLKGVKIKHELRNLLGSIL